MKHLFVVACLMACVSCQDSGAFFGLEKGMSAEEIKTMGFGDMIQGRPFEWVIPNAEKPEGMETMTLYIPPDRGLLTIIAVWHIRDSLDGARTQKRFRETRDSLSKKYGQGETADSLKTGSRLTRPHQYLKAISTRDRVLKWEKEMNSSLNRWSLESVEIKTLSFFGGLGVIMVVYHFSGSKDFITNVVYKE